MATWVNYVKANKFPHVLQAYQQIDSFKDAVHTEILATATWARLAPGVDPQGDLVWQVDVTAIPGVPALNSSGRV